MKYDVQLETQLFGIYGARSTQYVSLTVDFSDKFANNHPELKTSLGEYNRKFIISKNILTEFKEFCVEQGVEVDNEAFEKDQDYLAARIKSEIGRQFWEKQGFYYVWLHHDNQFLEAIHSFEEAKKIALLNN